MRQDRRIENVEEQRPDGGRPTEEPLPPGVDQVPEDGREQDERQPRPEHDPRRTVAEDDVVPELPLKPGPRRVGDRGPGLAAHRPAHPDEAQRQRADLLQERRVLQVDLELAGLEIRQAGADVRRLVEDRALDQAAPVGLRGEDQEEEADDDRMIREGASCRGHRGHPSIRATPVDGPGAVQ